VTCGPLLSVSAVCLATAVGCGRRFRLPWLLLTVGACVTALVAAATVLLHGDTWEWRSAFVFAGEPLHLRLDAISAYFLALLAFVGANAAIYATEYWPDRAYPQSAGRNRQWWAALLLAMGAVLLAANGLQFLIAWELFALSGYFLITLDRGNRAVRDAGWLYLVASHAGTLCLFALFTAIAVATGSWELGPLHHRPELAPLFWLALAGFGVKAGLFPLHIWLPSAHANAPSHVSAIFSGVAIKLGIYGIVRFSGWLPLPSGGGWTVLTIGAITALLGIAFAIAQTDLKRLLAYSSVENIGIILIGLGAALVGADQPMAGWARLALAGALLHVWNHGIFKSLLFFGAGSVLHATRTREMSRLGGLWRSMPWTTVLFAVGAIAVAALPPLNGFVSEWLIYLGLFDAATSRSSAAWIAMPAAIALAMTGAIALAAFVKAGGTIFLGAPRTTAAAHGHEPGWRMRGPMIGITIVAIVLGTAPVLVAPILGRVIGNWHADWSIGAVPSTLSTIGQMQIFVALALVVGVFGLAYWIRRRPIRVGPTWDCGYSAPSARMQYTAGSFGATAAGWFRWVLAPDQEIRRPRGVFPRVAYRAERTPEAVLQRVLYPASRGALAAAATVRRFQHGRLQSYIAYVVAAIAMLTAVAIIGGRS
jgi:hydrogenase-4 component B